MLRLWWENKGCRPILYPGYEKLPDYGASMGDEFAAWFYQNATQLPGRTVGGRDGCVTAALLIRLWDAISLGNLAF